MKLEELAFKDRKILANLNAVDLLNIIEFLQDDRRQCLEELSKTHNRSVEIQKKNQELKSQLKGTTHCFDEEEHRELKKQLHEASLTIQEMVEQDIECPSNCEKLRKIKKQLEVAEQQYNDLIEEKENLQEQLLISALQLEDLKLSRRDYTQENVLKMKMTKLETQQKEFINYLQKEINRYNAHIDAINSAGVSIYSPDYDNSKLKLAIFKEVLLKYIETIQTKNDKFV